VSRFRRLFFVALASGTIAGLLLFAVQHFTIFPLIEKAEVYEAAAENATPHHHEDEGWKPADGFERTALTAVTTVLTAIGFSAVLFGLTSFVPVRLTWLNGLLWGLAAFACVDLAPSIALPPQPPGTAVADLYGRQQWWILAVVFTALGLWLLLDRRKSAPVRALGFLLIVLPHVIGAPLAHGDSAVPVALVHEFAILSILTSALFWMVLGAIGGLLYARSDGEL
jgi:cobalt transporter subunit CbtA